MGHLFHRLRGHQIGQVKTDPLGRSEGPPADAGGITWKNVISGIG